MNLYIPVETAARELDGKLLLALHGVARGHKVVLGNRSMMSNIMHRFEPGVFFTHNFTRKRRRFLRIMRQLGHRIVGVDEEGLVWLDEDSYRHRRADVGAMGCMDTVFAWGAEHAEVLASAAGQPGPEIVAAGNPRADLLRPPLREIYRPAAQRLQEKYGNFILINSNFGILNFALAQSNGDGEKTDAELSELARTYQFPEGFFKFRYAVYRAFVKLLPELSAQFSDRQIVIRPHPSENPAAWIEASKGLDNILVKYDAELIPWLMAADAVIHNGCTTALETAVLGRPAIMYRPVDGGEFEIRQPLKVSILAEDKTRLFAAIENPQSGNETIDAELANLVSGLQGPTSSQRIIDAISALPQREPVGRISRLAGQTRSLWRGCERSLRKLDRSSLAHADYIDHKFPPISAGEVSARMAEFAGRLEMPLPQITELSDRIFSIEQK